MKEDEGFLTKYKSRLIGALVSALTVAAFVISFNALRHFFIEIGIVGDNAISYLFPVIIDGFIVIAMVLIFDASKNGFGSGYIKPLKFYVGISTIISVVLNGLHAYNLSLGIDAIIVSGIPPIAIFFSTEMLSRYLLENTKRGSIQKTIAEMLIESKTLLRKVADLKREGNVLQGEIEGKRKELKKSSLELNDKAGKIETLDKKIEGSAQKVKVLGAEVAKLMREKSLVKKWFESIANGSSKAVQKQRADMVKLIAEDMGKTAKTARNNLSTIEKRVMSNGKVKAQ